MNVATLVVEIPVQIRHCPRSLAKIHRTISAELRIRAYWTNLQGQSWHSAKTSGGWIREPELLANQMRASGGRCALAGDAD